MTIIIARVILLILAGVAGVALGPSFGPAEP